MTKDESEWNVFLCHNSQEKPQVEKIRQHLQEQGIKTWLDRYDFEPFRPWPDQLEEIIDQIKSAAIFIGSSGVGPWQDIEMKSFLSEFVSRKLRMGLVILPGCSDEIIQKVPKFYEQFQRVDFRKKIPDPVGQLFWGITGQKLSGYLQSKLTALIEQKNALEIEIGDVNRRLDAVEALRCQRDPDLQAILYWLSSIKDVAMVKEYGSKTLKKFPKLKDEVVKKGNLDKFYLEIRCYLDFIVLSLEKDDGIFIDEPALPPTLADSYISESASIDVYKEFFILIKDRIPERIEPGIKDKLGDKIDSFLRRLVLFS